MRFHSVLSVAVVVVTLGLSAAVGAAASPVFVDDGAAIRGYDPVAYFDRKGPVKGRSELSAEYDGAIWWFASAANRDAFKANPERYAPAYGGYCSYAASRGRLQGVDRPRGLDDRG